jgi:hypothetical protein
MCGTRCMVLRGRWTGACVWVYCAGGNKNSRFVLHSVGRWLPLDAAM